ncbi:DNA-directed RNA polymerase III subunit RPC10-like isoform X1 [Populus alba x Populus x berolinensis]|uniref:DNA-directed RNA polymerase III subunit RPC10-like isoform X1 n=1 Tax=Populus alba x Populus x berolinensis TaxID=444605 RepID=A0AAD6RGB3_9ROSI|nr:DNA-directed RNA polymerase III subunit RPC10-like isoform X1 [Populus alba x Populus x berolinensis]
MEFCPTCGMLLRYEPPNMGQAARFYCPTCPYFASIESRVKIKRKQKLAKKEIEPIFSLEDMKKGGAKTDGIQIRSADEPATTFYFCLNKKLLREEVATRDHSSFASNDTVRFLREFDECMA